MTVGDTIELAFLCDSPEEVDALHSKVVAAGYQSFKEPWSAFWGQRYAIVKEDHCCAANHPFRGSTGIDGVCQLILSLWH